MANLFEIADTPSTSTFMSSVIRFLVEKINQSNKINCNAIRYLSLSVSNVNKRPVKKMKVT